MPSDVGRWWFATISQLNGWMPVEGMIDSELVYMRGQLEVGEGGFTHYQVIFCFTKNVRLSFVKKKICDGGHFELGRSKAALDYVWKEDTRVEGTQFEFGRQPFKRNSKEDWDLVKAAAMTGDFTQIPAKIFVSHYRNIVSIRKDYMVKPLDLTDVCGEWYYGPPGVGKSYTARLVYPDSYMKPCSKWWDGYQEQRNVIIDDFDRNHKVLGHHLKIWADRYSFLAESKGSAMHIRPSVICITSNYRIEDIFDDDFVLCEAIKRRFKVRNFNIPDSPQTPTFMRPRDAVVHTGDPIFNPPVDWDNDE